jgi:hypothetical protein
MNAIRSQRVASAVATAVAGVAIVLCGTGGAQAQVASHTLPPVTLSSSTFHLGDTITVSGTGCLDSASGSGAGGQVRLIRRTTGGRGGSGSTVDVTITPNTDGSFSGSGTVSQPLDVIGPQNAGVVCSFPNAPDLFREVPIEVVAPTLPALTVQAGATTHYTLPCTIEGGDYGRLSIDLGGGAGDGPYLSVSSRYGQDASFEQGKVVPLDVPATIPPGDYRALVTCSISEIGVQASFVQTVTISPASVAPATSPPSGTVGAKTGARAVAAMPVRATASYTG